MKFLFLSGHAHLALDPDAQSASGGAELQVALLARELIARGHAVTLLTADTGVRDKTFLEGIFLRSGGRFDTGGGKDTLKALPSVLKILFQEKPNVVVIYGWTAWLYLLAFWKKIVGYRLVFICALDSEIEGGICYTNQLRQALFKRGMRKSDLRFGITDHQVKLFQEQGMSCLLTRLLLQQADQKQAVLTEKPIDLLWVARCHSVKQPLLFLDLAAQMPEVRCQMISFPQDLKLWKEVQERVALLPHVELLESVPYHQIQDFFNRAKIFVNTSLEEGVPNTFIHAGLGHTAIASLRINPDAMFQHFKAGLYAGDCKESFFAGIKHLLKEKEQLTLAQQEAARFVEEWHSNKKNVTAFLEGVMS